MVATIRPAAGRRPEDAPSARVFASRAAQCGDSRVPVPFWIHGGPDGSGGASCSVRPAAPDVPDAPDARDARDVYDVRTAEGVPLARITRRAGRLLPWPRRVRWSAQVTGAPRPVTGRVGTWYAWLCYVVTAPVWFLFALGAMVYAFFDGTADDWTFRRPARTRWRAPGAGTVLDYRGVSRTYRSFPGRLDARVAYALAVLRSREDT
ncbi:hypothetical protein ACFOOM_04660 [Streptomyces echinoruber]|nr:hypothetical protein [Streptomyces echinoruber]